MIKPFIRVEICLSEDQLVSIYPGEYDNTVVLEDASSMIDLVLTKDDVECLIYHLKHMITYIES